MATSTLSAANTGGIATTAGNYSPSTFAAAPKGSYEAQLYSATPAAQAAAKPAPVTPPGGPATSAPVATSSAAQADYAAKQSSFADMQAANAAQATQVQQKQMADAQAKQAADTAAQAQANINTQNQQKQQEITAKNAALGVAVPNYGDKVAGSDQTAKFNPNTGAPLTPPAPTADQQIQSGLNNTTDQYLSAQAQLQSQKDAQASQMNDQLNSLLSGTIPLSGPQASLIASVQAQLSQNVQSQQIANQAYVGQVSEAAFRQGGEYTNQQMSGQIANAVSYGVAKISELDNAAAKTMADLEQSFQKQNFDVISKQYDLMTKQLDDKASAIKNTYDTVTKQLTDQRSYNMDLAKFAQTQDQQAFDRAFRTEQQVYDEKYKNATFAQNQSQNAFDNKIKSATLGLEKQKFAATQAQSQAASVGSASMSASNRPDAASQAAVLTQIAGQYGAATAQLVKGISNYTINPTDVSARQTGGLNRALIVSLAQQYDPTFSQSQFATRQALQTAFTSGKYSQNINSLNTAVGHISDVLSNTQGLNNAGFTPFNQAKNSVESLFGAGGVTRASVNINAATSELASVFKGTGATDQEIKALGSIDANSSPDQVKAYVETASQLLSSRLQALNDTYTSGMGKAPATPFLSTTSQTALMNLQKQGLNIQVPELQNSPISKIQTFAGSSPQNSQVYGDLIKQFPNATPDQIAQVLNLQ